MLLVEKMGLSIQRSRNGSLSSHYISEYTRTFRHFYIYIYIYILITIKMSKMTLVTSQALYKKNIEIKEKKKKINESSDEF